MSRPIVLCVDDEKLVLETLKEQLLRRASGDFTVETAESGEEALELFEELINEGREIAVVLSDHIMPGMKGTELLATLHRRHRRALKILLTGQADAEAVGRAVNEASLYRYITKPWLEDDMLLTLREALRSYQQDRRLEEQNRELERLNAELRAAVSELEAHKNRLEAENVYLQQEIELERGAGGIVGKSEALERVLFQVDKVATSKTSVLILGESGTGKELIARAIHDASERAGQRMVKLNCAALPATLVESELFGHEKGAFSGAVARRLGRFELADGGTLFLDEIGEMPLETQAKLLRVLQEGEIERLGSADTVPVDVRMIAATNRDLKECVARGTFREDLYYRLSVFPIRLPPLRERRGDIEILAQHFVRKFSARLAKEIDSISKRSLAKLTAYEWPGNVRELQNVIERATILASDRCLDIDIPLDAPPAEPLAAERPRTLREMEIELIKAALEHCNGVIGGKNGAAKRLDIPPSTLRERMQRYGISR